MLTNSPGEIGGWFLPLAKIIKETYPAIDIIAILLPCQYASGTEYRVLLESGLFSRVIDRKELLKFLTAPDLDDKRKLILQLGGDPYWGTLLKIRLKSKLFIYSDSLVHTNRWADKILLSDPRFSRGGENEVVVGNLILESIDRNLSVDGSAIAFLPGSRPYGLKLILPLMLETAEILKKTLDDSIKFIVSPFIPLETLNRYVPVNFRLEGDKIISGSGNVYILEYGGSWDWVRDVGLAINIPGTNTLQLALLGIPQITILPLQWAEYIPLEGMVEWISRIPLIGKPIKKRIIYRLIPKIRFVALPNIISKRKITEELIMEVTPEFLAQKILELLNDQKRLDKMREELRSIDFLSGAGRNITDIIGEELCEQS